MSATTVDLPVAPSLVVDASSRRADERDPRRRAPAVLPSWPRPGRAGAPAVLLLEDGTVFRGRAFGATGTTFGEAVFNTGMSGYQEVLTDPSYNGQIVAMTTAHVGNYGLNPDDGESDRIQVSGFVVREASRRASSWRATTTLHDGLAQAGIIGIEGVDTRALTLHLRERGAMRAAISTDVLDVDALAPQVEASPSIVGADLASVVTTTEPYTVEPTARADRAEQRFRVVAVDHGIKRNILRQLAAHGCHVTVLPSSATPDDVRAHEPDGLFVSNGPGDPAAVTQGIDTLRELLGELPVFGICLGSQLLGHALGADTYKLRFGHRGANQPVLDRRTGTVEITSHNHGFAVQGSTLGEQVDVHTFRTAEHGLVDVSHVNLNDDVVEGLTCRDVPAFTVQYHPEAAPGPHDARHLFERFTALMASHGKGV